MTTATYRLQTPLDCLNILIDQVYEFPEAVDKTSEALAVNRDELVAAYDSQGWMPKLTSPKETNDINRSIDPDLNPCQYKAHPPGQLWKLQQLSEASRQRRLSSY